MSKLSWADGSPTHDEKAVSLRHPLPATLPLKGGREGGGES